MIFQKEDMLIERVTFQHAELLNTTAQETGSQSIMIQKKLPRPYAGGILILNTKMMVIQTMISEPELRLERLNKCPSSFEDELDSTKTKMDSMFNISFDEYITVPFGNNSEIPPPGNNPIMLPPPKQGILKCPLDIYKMNLDWAPWKIDS
ncbi:13368_t:CDS:2 [Acaulospora morrowiae]|uniref:13368_t:CDS:1 n=1 Tax=Acaulospora morrowiae TaxID=94023 RepID=A0A9N9AU52_9GLOM|nr:13368_t:CDS:2 [Acaulospora morrowiae]